MITLEQIKEEYLNTPETERSLTKLSNKYGTTRQKITKYLRDSGVEIINYQNRLRIDETVFDIIDTEEKAYWLGFLYADGNVAKNEERFMMNLAVADIDHMKKFKDFLKSTSPICVNTCINNKGEHEMCRFSVRNKNLYKQLIEKGCVPQKTLILTFPDENVFFDKKLIKDFIRGYCDGDGTLGLYYGKYGKHFEVSFAGTFNFLNGIQKYLNLQGYIQQQKNSKIFCLSYRSLKARKVARILYENSSIYLTRKYNRFKEFCRVEEESSTLRSSKIGESCDANPEVN